MVDWTRVRKECFVVSPIGKEGTERFETFRQVLDRLIRPAVESTTLGLRVVRADEIYQSGSFIRDVLDYLANAHTVIADVTGQNANVFYELGVRHTLSPRTILMAQREEDIPADLREYRVLIYGDIAAEPALEARRATLRRYFDEIDWEPEKPDNPVLSWLKIPQPPDDLRKSFTARLSAAGQTQTRILRFVESETRDGGDVSQSEIERRFTMPGTETYYRLEQLRLLGFIDKQRREDREFAYRLTPDYRRELGLPPERSGPEVSLVSPQGTLLKFGSGNAAPDAFFFFLRVRNSRDTDVGGVRAIITRVRRFDSNGVPIEDNTDPMPLKWRTGQGGDRCSALRIGSRSEAVAILGYIIEGYEFFQMDICKDPWPPGYPAAVHTHQRSQVEVIAEFAGGRRSPRLSIDITWDGEWHRDPAEMQRHLRIGEVRG